MPSPLILVGSALCGTTRRPESRFSSAPTSRYGSVQVSSTGGSVSNVTAGFARVSTTRRNTSGRA